MTRYKTETEEMGGWTREIYPIMDGYKMACCDCGLVHVLKFEVRKVSRKKRDGSFQTESALGSFRVMMQVKRDNRATAAVRRERKKKGGFG